MFELLRKINIAAVISDHIATLEDARRKGAVKQGDLWVFYGIPAAATAVIMFYRVAFTDTTITVITTALSILAGLLINLWVLIHSLPWDKHEEPMKSKVANVLHQLHANIGYAIVVSLLALLPLVVAGNYDAGQFGVRRRVFGYVASYLSIHFGLTMVMVIKRIYLMLQYRLPESR